MTSYTSVAPIPLKILSVWPDRLAEELDNLFSSIKGSVMFDNCQETDIGKKLQPDRYHMLIIPPEVWCFLADRQQNLFQSRVPFLVLTPLTDMPEPIRQSAKMSVPVLTWKNPLPIVDMFNFFNYFVNGLISSRPLQDALTSAWRETFEDQIKYSLFLTGAADDIWPMRISNKTSTSSKRKPQISKLPPVTLTSQPTITFNESTIRNVIQSPGEVTINQNFPASQASEETNISSYKLNPSVSIETLRKLFQFMLDAFNEEDLRKLCFLLAVEYDSLPGRAKSAKTQELISYVDRNGRLDELIEIIKEERPDRHLDLPDP